MSGGALRQATGRFIVETRGKGLTDLTATLNAFVHREGFTAGLLTVWCRHTSASLTVQENAARAVRTDIEHYFDALAPEGAGRYTHDDEGPDDMPAHLRSMLTDTSLAIPVIDGRPALGTWQAVYLFEHRRAPHRREIALHILGD